LTNHLLGVAEIALMLKLSRQRVHQLMREDRTFPAPVAVLKAGGVWERVAVEAWARRTGRTVGD